ncbi:hypothetical protein [Selenomonas sp. oral taxon 138]|nr:hypothetical protein [Selenomonas sp. oral taxon 138]
MDSSRRSISLLVILSAFMAFASLWLLVDGLTGHLGSGVSPFQC